MGTRGQETHGVHSVCEEEELIVVFVLCLQGYIAVRKIAK